MMTSIKSWVASCLPDSFLGIVEFHRHPELAEYWGGPFNGQRLRQQTFLELIRACRFEAVVETGAFRGATTSFLAQNSAGAPVYSCESNARFFEFAKRRLQGVPNLSLFKMDSRRFIQRLELHSQTKVFFYLDAHWGADLPLQGELDAICAKFKEFVVMIDDFEVPNDPQYGFDDYGEGKRLSLRDFPFHEDQRLLCYFPARPSSEETGLKRGSIVLASPALRESISGISSLIPLAEVLT